MKVYKVGLVKENFVDQDYLRDRDENIYNVDNEKDAINEYIRIKKGWLKKSEEKYVKVIEIR
jgi:hypothetical protein